MRTNIMGVLGTAMFEWPYEIQDSMLALRAAEKLALRFKCDVAIMDDLSVLRLEDAKEKPLDIVRFKG